MTCVCVCVCVCRNQAPTPSPTPAPTSSPTYEAQCDIPMDVVFLFDEGCYESESDCEAHRQGLVEFIEASAGDDSSIGVISYSRFGCDDVVPLGTVGTDAVALRVAIENAINCTEWDNGNGNTDFQCALFNAQSMLNSDSRVAIETSVVLFPTCDHNDECDIYADYFADNCVLHICTVFPVSYVPKKNALLYRTWFRVDCCF